MKKDYMTRLERAARWRLPRQEAEDVIADYRDIVGNPPRPEKELRQQVGDPEQVVKLLVSPPKAYRVWLAVFAALTACLLAAALAPLPLSPSFRLSLWYEWFSGYRLSDPEFSILSLLPFWQLAAGMGLCLAWFLRRREAVSHPRSKWMLLCALLLAVIMAYAWSVVWRISANPELYLTVWEEDPSFIGDGISYRANFSRGLLGMSNRLEWGCCALSGLVGTVALVKARTQDRRWAAIYLLALTAAVLSLAVLAMLANFSDLTPHNELFRYTYSDGWLTPYLPQFAAVTALGLIGSGMALC